MYSLENNLHTTEVVLSFVTAIPVLGIAGGAAKALLGTVQTVSAVAIVIFAAIASVCCSKWGVDGARASKHILHGLGNIFGGVVESIPVVGSVSAYFRINSLASAHPIGPGGGNYMAYKDLYDPRSVFDEDKIGWYDTTPLPLIKV